MFSTLFSVNPIATSLTRMRDGMFMDINEAYLRDFGIERNEAVGCTSRALEWPFQGAQRAELIRRLQRDGIVRDVELELTLHSGDVRSVLASLQHLTVDGTEALLSTFIDITGACRPSARSAPWLPT